MGWICRRSIAITGMRAVIWLAPALTALFQGVFMISPGGKQRWLKRLRDREMVRLASTGGKGVKELATMFRLSQRTVQRALKRVKNE